MEREDFIRVFLRIDPFLPEFVLASFDVTGVKDLVDGIHISLDQKKDIPQELKSKNIISYGFTSITTIQDFPIRGKRVYLHIRRRKWLNKIDNTIHTTHLDVTHLGTQLTE